MPAGAKSTSPDPGPMRSPQYAVRCRGIVPVSGNGSRLLLHGYSRLYAVAPRK